MDLPTKISVANKYRERAQVLVKGEYTDDLRVCLSIAYTEVVIEHHAAIMLLLASKTYGSAFALVRILYEPFMRAHWVAACASDDDVQKIAAQEFEFPPMNDIVSTCDAAFGTDHFFQTIKARGWKAMNCYTHCGIRQLTRRFNDGKIKPNYSDEEVDEVINATTMMVLLQALLLSRVVGKCLEEGEAERLVLQFADERTRYADLAIK